MGRNLILGPFGDEWSGRQAQKDKCLESLVLKFFNAPQLVVYCLLSLN